MKNRLIIFLIAHLYSIQILAMEAPFILINPTNVNGNQLNITCMPCLVNSPCNGCNISSNNSCSNCTDNSCQACNKGDNPRFSTGCSVCDRTSVDSDCNSCISCNIGPSCVPCQQSCYIACNKPKSIFVPRSQGADTARELVGWQEFIYRLTSGCNYITTAHTLSYTQSFKANEISQYLFGKCSLDFAGSQISDRLPGSLIADYFGLSPYFRGNLNFNPTIQNIIFDNQIFFGLDANYCGAFARIHAPVVYTRWSLNPCQTQDINANGCLPFPKCYMSSETASATCNILQALSGDFLFGDMQQPWQFGRFSSCARTKVGFADVDLIAGWNFWQDPISHIGIFVQGVVPTGNKPNGRFVFEPIIGNGKHWELGGGITTHLVLWDFGCDQVLALYLEGNVTHMFANTQCRSFDFCANGPLSRYTLLKEFKQENDNFIYTGNLINAINFTTIPVNVSISVKGDVSAKLAFRSTCWNFDVGYNFYGNTQDCIQLKSDCPTTNNKLYALKGTSDVCALEYNITDTMPKEFGSLQQKLAITSTQSCSTICTAGQTDNEAYVQAGNNQIAVTSFSKQTGSIEAPGVILATTSTEPNFVSKKDLDLESGAAAATATHKVFAFFNYTPLDICINYRPYIGFGGYFEVNALACNERTSLNQWGIWVKGGFAF